MATAMSLSLSLSASRVHGKTFETRDAALRRVFGSEVTVERRTAFLTEAQVDSVQRQARARVGQARVTYYRASHGDSVVGHAYLDTHLVRSLYETLLVVVDRRGRLQTVEVLAFHEPLDYLPPRLWLQTLQGRRLTNRLRPGDQIDALSGATLTARAACDAVRRTLAIDRTLHLEPDGNVSADSPSLATPAPQNGEPR